MDAMQIAFDVMNKIANIREERLKAIMDGRSLTDLHSTSTRTPNGEQEEYFQGDERLMTFRYYSVLMPSGCMGISHALR